RVKELVGGGAGRVFAIAQDAGGDHQHRVALVVEPEVPGVAERAGHVPAAVAEVDVELEGLRAGGDRVVPRLDLVAPGRLERGRERSDIGVREQGGLTPLHGEVRRLEGVEVAEGVADLLARGRRVTKPRAGRGERAEPAG